MNRTARYFSGHPFVEVMAHGVALAPYFCDTAGEREQQRSVASTLRAFREHELQARAVAGTSRAVSGSSERFGWTRQRIAARLRGLEADLRREHLILSPGGSADDARSGRSLAVLRCVGNEQIKAFRTVIATNTRASTTDIVSTSAASIALSALYLGFTSADPVWSFGLPLVFGGLHIVLQMLRVTDLDPLTTAAFVALMPAHTLSIPSTLHALVPRPSRLAPFSASSTQRPPQPPGWWFHSRNVHLTAPEIAAWRHPTAGTPETAGGDPYQLSSHTLLGMYMRLAATLRRRPLTTWVGLDQLFVHHADGTPELIVAVRMAARKPSYTARQGVGAENANARTAIVTGTT